MISSVKLSSVLVYIYQYKLRSPGGNKNFTSSLELNWNVKRRSNTSIALKREVSKINIE